MSRSSASMTIKHVVDRLSGAYPTITASKIRFLEEQGLLHPARSASGYRLYREQDIARIESILRMQQLHYYPLSVIKAKLKAADQGEQVDEVTACADRENLSALAHQKHAIETVPHLLNVDVSFVRSLADCGLLTLSVSPKGRALVDGHDLPLIKAAAELNRYGIDPRHLRVYSQSVNRECLVFDSVLSSVLAQGHKDGAADNNAAIAHTFQHLNELTSTIRTSLLRRELSARFSV